MATPSPWVLRFAHRIRTGGSVLDLAAGSGRHARWLRDQGYRVTAVDIDASKLIDLAGDPAVEVVETDLEGSKWPFSGRRFDGIVVTNYLHRPLLASLARSLLPGGVLIYETFGEGHERHGRPRNPEYLLKKEELLRAYEHCLDVVAYEHIREAEPRLAVRQRICAVLPEDTPDAPQAHADARGGPEPE